MEQDDEASLEDLRLLLQKERVVFSITSTSRHVIFATIFTPRVVGQRRSTPGRSMVSQQSVSGRSAVGQPMTAQRRSVFYEKYHTSGRSVVGMHSLS